MTEQVDERPEAAVGLREILADAVRYWEVRRWIYNAALAVVVLIVLVAQGQLAWKGLTLQTALWIFIQAVLANIAYCAAYPVDVVLQFSSLRQSWRARRWYLLLVGTLFACAIAYFVSLAILAPQVLD